MHGQRNGTPSGVSRLPRRLEAALQRSQTAPFLTGSLEQEVRSALALYDTQFKNSKTYLLHGDLHHYNLLRTAEGYRAIDPIGCLAPIEFEFTRFIRNDILQHPGFDPRERLQLLLRYFSRWAEPNGYRQHCKLI